MKNEKLFVHDDDDDNCKDECRHTQKKQRKFFLRESLGYFFSYRKFSIQTISCLLSHHHGYNCSHRLELSFGRSRKKFIMNYQVDIFLRFLSQFLFHLVALASPSPVSSVLGRRHLQWSTFIIAQRPSERVSLFSTFFPSSTSSPSPKRYKNYFTEFYLCLCWMHRISLYSLLLLAWNSSSESRLARETVRDVMCTMFTFFPLLLSQGRKDGSRCRAAKMVHTEHTIIHSTYI